MVGYSPVLDEIDLTIGMDAVCTLMRVRSREPLCADPAAWACQLSCCGYVKVVCAKHRDIPFAIFPKTFVCAGCATPKPSIVRTWPI
jgi:hypothetical protein